MKTYKISYSPNGIDEIEISSHDTVEEAQAAFDAIDIYDIEPEDRTAININVMLINTKGDEYDVISGKRIDSINRVTDQMVDEVQKHFGGKYTNWYCGDETLELRIADHSGNGFNKDFGADYLLSVVIANQNATQDFRRSSKGISGELVFDSDSTVEEIIEAVKQEIANKFRSRNFSNELE